MNNVISILINSIKYEIFGQGEKVVSPELSVRFLIEVYKLS